MELAADKPRMSGQFHNFHQFSVQRIAREFEAGALQRLGGNQKLYRTLLERFYAGYNKFGQDIQASLAAGNLEEAQRNAHTIKGLAGTIGHAGLAEASLALETACKNAAQASGGLSELEPGLAQFLAQLETVIGALSTIFGPPAA